MPTPPPVSYTQIQAALTTLLPTIPLSEILWICIEPNAVTYETWNAAEQRGEGHRVRVTHAQGSATEGGEPE